MNERLKCLREKRGKMVADMQAILDTAEKERRSPTDEELAKHGEIFAAQECVRKEIEAEERAAELRREDAEAASGAVRRDGAAQTATGRLEAEVRELPGYLGEAFRNLDFTAEIRRRDAFARYLRTGIVGGDGAEELRALAADVDVEGGYIVAPQTFVASLIKAVDDLVFVRGRATVFPVGNAQSLGAPSLDADPADADWTSELGTGNEDTAMKFGARELNPHPLAKRIKVSNKLLRVGVLPVESIVRDRLAYKFAITQEKAYMTGNGAKQPLGLFTASADGISTARDVATGNAATTVSFDGLIAAKYALKAQYWQNASWAYHPDVVQQIATLKNTQGQYYWQPSTQEGQPDRILSFPVMMSEYAPNTFTSGKYVGLLGDLSRYWIADSLVMQVQRLVELYAETNQTGFIGRLESDAMPVLEEAFVRVTLA